MISTCMDFYVIIYIGDDMKENLKKYAKLLLKRCLCLDYNRPLLVTAPIKAIDFIENVVIKGIDKKKEERNKFAKNEVMFNYPNATEYIFNYLK